MKKEKIALLKSELNSFKAKVGVLEDELAGCTSKIQRLIRENEEKLSISLDDLYKKVLGNFLVLKNYDNSIEKRVKSLQELLKEIAKSRNEIIELSITSSDISNQIGISMDEFFKEFENFFLSLEKAVSFMKNQNQKVDNFILSVQNLIFTLEKKAAILETKEKKLKLCHEREIKIPHLKSASQNSTPMSSEKKRGTVSWRASAEEIKSFFGMKAYTKHTPNNESEKNSEFFKKKIGKDFKELKEDLLFYLESREKEISEILSTPEKDSGNLNAVIKIANWEISIMEAALGSINQSKIMKTEIPTPSSLTNEAISKFCSQEIQSFKNSFKALASDINAATTSSSIKSLISRLEELEQEKIQLFLLIVKEKVALQDLFSHRDEELGSMQEEIVQHKLEVASMAFERDQYLEKLNEAVDEMKKKGFDLSYLLED